jgi:hypothetical protein
MAEHMFAVSEREYQKVLLDLERENRLKREHVARMELALRSFSEDIAAPVAKGTTGNGHTIAKL